MIKINWSVEEMVALVDLYYKVSDIESAECYNELTKLSALYNKRAKIIGIEHDEKFRNITGLKMIMQNIKYIDSNGKEGLANVSNMACYIVYMRKADRNRFNDILNDFYKKYGE